jgi:hypothetical protein
MFGMILRDLAAIGYMKASPDKIELDKIPPHVVNSVHSVELGGELDTTLIMPIVTFLQSALASGNAGHPDTDNGNARAGPSKETRPVLLALLHLLLSDGFVCLFTEKGKKRNNSWHLGTRITLGKP